MIRTAFQTMHPFGQFIFFACIILTGMGLAAGLGLFLMTQWTGDTMVEAMASMSAPSSSDGREYNLALNSLNQILSFGLAAFLARYLFKGQTLVTGRVPRVLGWMVWGVVFAWCAQPLIDLTYRLNTAAMEFLPMSWVTQADLLEKMAQDVTVSLLSFDAAWQFPATLVAVAILPAICEELTFRGVLQPLFARWTGSVHLGIWITALLFSAIHLQFHGFLPRMILGAGLGYLVHYSGSLWPAIVAHFLNNAMAVCLAAWFGAEWVQEEMVAMGAWELSDYLNAAVALPVAWMGFKWLQKRTVTTNGHPTTVS
jgi:uncharacterized protein